MTTIARNLGSAVQGSYVYQGAMANAGRQFNITLNYGQIAIVFFLSSVYLVIASIGLDMYSKCDELKDNETQQGLNKWMIATLAIAITIPFTLFITKVAGGMLTAIMMLIFAIMGIIGSSTSLNWSMECEGVDDDKDSRRIYSGINLASFVCLCIITMYMMRPTGRR